MTIIYEYATGVFVILIQQKTNGGVKIFQYFSFRFSLKIVVDFCVLHKLGLQIGNFWLKVESLLLH